MNIKDKNGTWFLNTGAYPIVDTDTNTRFEPGEPVKATATEFVKGQPTLVITADPTSDLTEKEQAKIDAANKAAEQKRIDAQLAAEAAQAAARSDKVEAPADAAKA